MSTTHLMTASGTVRCGAPMRDGDHPTGWDLGTASPTPGRTTCPGCSVTPSYDSYDPNEDEWRMVAMEIEADRESAS